MYLDVKGLVTTGVGNLIDPVEAALRLPWKRAGEPASPDRVRQEWWALKGRQELRLKHHKFAAAVTTVRLTEEDIDELVAQKLRANEIVLAKTFPRWDAFPADAQLGILSMAWALGAGFPKTFKNFARAVLAEDWKGAAESCAIRDGLSTPDKSDDNPGVVPRNKANRLCFLNAASGGDPETLHWPNAAEIAPPLPPTPLAGPVSVAESIVADGLRDMSTRDTDPAPPPESVS